MLGKPTCTRSGGKVVQVKPRDKDSKDLTMRCCGVQKCKMPEKDTVCPPGLCRAASQDALIEVVKSFK